MPAFVKIMPAMSTPESRKRATRVLSFKYAAVGPLPNSRLQFNRLNFSNESLAVVGKERTDHVEHGLTEANDIENVRSLAILNYLVRLQIDVEQLRRYFLT